MLIKPTFITILLVVSYIENAYSAISDNIQFLMFENFDLNRQNFIEELKIVKVLQSYRDNLKNAKNFINKFGNPYSQIIIDNEGILSIEFGAYGVPETFIIDKDKKIIKRFAGPINKKIVDEIKLIIK